MIAIAIIAPACDQVTPRHAARLPGASGALAHGLLVTGARARRSLDGSNVRRVSQPIVLAQHRQLSVYAVNHLALLQELCKESLSSWQLAWNRRKPKIGKWRLLKW
jgi:hypothetical protein